ncbi:MAG: hypothetical protein MJ014_00295 [Methanocorpusculum sp.]|nr:hypothetical protein [Methanocorpusculum sp.]
MEIKKRKPGEICAALYAEVGRQVRAGNGGKNCGNCVKGVMKMKRLFISQPMRGKTNEEIEKVRKQATKAAKEYLKEDVEVIDSFFKDAPCEAKPLWFLGKSIELLSTADVAYFAKGWEEARGCKIENECAIEYGIDVIEDYRE